MIALEHKIPPPIVTVLIGLIMWLTAPYTPPGPLDGTLRLAWMLGALVAGLGFLLGGFFALQQARTTIDPIRLDAASALVTRGIFRMSRNPMYVGFACLLAAWAGYLAAPWTLLGVVAFVVFISRFQIQPEERVMRAKFGADYAAYVVQVRRWL